MPDIDILESDADPFERSMVLEAMLRLGETAPFAVSTGNHIAGDVVSTDGHDVALGAEVGNANSQHDGVNGHSIIRFCQVLSGTPGDDIVAGDVLLTAGGQVSLSTVVGCGADGAYGSGYDGGNANRASSFNDRVAGGDGTDRLSGDVITTGNEHTSLSVITGVGGRYGSGGDRNHVVAFSDTMAGGSGDDIIAGDVLLTESGRFQFQIALTNWVDSDGNTAVAFTDTITGGTGNDAIAGDVLAMAENGVDLIDIGGGGDGNRAFNDVLSGGAGDDTIAGDVFAMGGGQFNLTTLDGNGSAFSDHLSGGDGFDFLSGDVMSFGRGTADLNASVGDGSSGRYGEYIGSFSNTVIAFSDVVRGGSGGDFIFGDVIHPDGETALRLSVGNDLGGTGGDRNEVHGFNDTLAGADGDDVLVGDAGGSFSTAVTLVAAVGNASSSYRYHGGSSNVVDMCCDRLQGGADNDVLVGDITGAHSTSLTVAAGVGASSVVPGYTGDAGGSNNVVTVGHDLLSGNGGDDQLTGDISVQVFDQSRITFSIAAGLDGAGRAGGQGGTGNAVSVCNDVLFGGDGDDVLVGDVGADGVFVPISISIGGEAGNRISAFRDQLDGGNGDDALWGDVFDGFGSFAPSTLVISGSFAGRNLLFSDTLLGGAGNDTLGGGLGADVLSGSTGDDQFVWDSGDLTRLSASGATPVDRVTDFSRSEDVLDFRGLLASLGFGENSHVQDYLRLQHAGGATVVQVDEDGTGGTHGFEDAIRLEDFTTTLSLQQLIDQGSILIA